MKMKKTATFLLALSLVINLFAMPATAVDDQISQYEDGMTSAVTQEETETPLGEAEQDFLSEELPCPSEPWTTENDNDFIGVGAEITDTPASETINSIPVKPFEESDALLEDEDNDLQSLSKEAGGAIVGSGAWGDNITWELTADGVLTLTGEGDMITAHSFPWESYSSEITTLTMDNRITSIAPWAFYQCTNLIQAELPAGVTSIGKYTFYECINLDLTDLPTGVNSIGEYAFFGCKNLTLTELPVGLTFIERGVFENCTNLNLAELPAGLTYIGNYAFYGCANLTLTELPAELTSIGISAFYGCANLTLTELPAGLTYIGSAAFLECINLSLTELPAGLTSIRDGVFENCTNLNLTELPAGLTSIGSQVFRGCINLTLTELPDGLTSIGDFAFSGCTSLALTELPAGLTSIGNFAFSECTSLALTELPAGLISIGRGVFQKCTNLNLTELPAGLTSIGDSAFWRCANLALTELPAGLTSIGNFAFSECTSLTLTELPAGIISIGDCTFAGCANLTLTELPAGLTSIGRATFNGCVNLNLVELPDGLTSIGDDAFSGCANLTLTELPDGLRNIGARAFVNCVNMRLTELPESVSLVGMGAFRSCNWPVSTQHYIQETDGKYVLAKTTTWRKQTYQQVTAQIESFDHYHLASHKDELLSQEVPEYISYGESITLRRYYDLDTLMVTLNPKNGSESISQDVPYGGTITVPEDPNKPGYTFDGWKDQYGNAYDFDSPVTDVVTLTAAWNAKGDTPYQVKHYQQTVDGSSYALKDTEDLTATTDTSVTATTKSYKGFHENTAAKDRKPAGSVAGDGSLTLALYYDRDTITVSIDPGDGDPTTQEVPYGGTITAPANPEKPGYTFEGWKDQNGQGFDLDTPVTEEISLFPIWTVKGDTPYQVDHYLQNLACDGYELKETDKLTAATDSLVEAIAKVYTGFHVAPSHLSRIATGTVAGDGSLVLNLYYDRDIITVSIDSGNGEPTIQEVPYGGTITAPEDPDKSGYIFDGWKVKDGDTFSFSMPITEEITLVPIWRSQGGSSGSSGGNSNRDPAPDSDQNQEEELLESDVPLTGIIFDDVLPGDPFYDDVMDAYHAGYMEGITATTFDPDSPLTRAQAAYTFTKMFGANLEGLAITGDFEDVTRNTHYAEFITWVNNAGVGIGYGNGNFGPTDGITREQLALMLYRTYGEHADVATWTEEFSDIDDVSDWSETAVRWAVSMDLLKGNAGQLSPQGMVTRAEAAVLIQAVTLLETGITK